MENNETKKKPIYKKWWFWVIIIVILASVGATSQDVTNNGDNPKIETKQTKEKFTLVSSDASYDGFGYYITGTITNNTSKQYSYVQVTFNLYDSDGAQIGTAMDNINNLEPNGTWKYKALGLEKADSYKLAEITGW